MRLQAHAGNLSSLGALIKNWPLAHPALRAGYSLLRRLHYGRVVVTEIGGVRYELDLSETIDSSLYFRGVYERSTSRALRELVRPNMVVIEVGANIGAHTFEIARLLSGERGVLYSFEPTGYAFAKLVRNHSLNNFRNIVLERIALSDRNETRSIHRATSAATMPFRASWDIRTKEPKNRSLDEITFETLDHYCERKSIPRVDLLKIDVDGYECRVLTGALATLRRDRPAMIIELGTTVERLGDTLEQLVALLTDLDYVIRPVDSSVPCANSELLQEVRKRRTMDCLCLPR